MPVNLELKVPITDLREITHWIIESGAKQKEILYQKDIYYCVPRGLLKLRTTSDLMELIFYERNEEKANRWSDYHILDLTCTDAPAFLDKVFGRETVVIKKRVVYLYKDTRIHLDTVHGLGRFLELETVVTKTRERAAGEFNCVIRLLHLDVKKQILKSYRDIMLEKGRKYTPKRRYRNPHILE